MRACVLGGGYVAETENRYPPPTGGWFLRNVCKHALAHARSASGPEFGFDCSQQARAVGRNVYDLIGHAHSPVEFPKNPVVQTPPSTPLARVFVGKAWSCAGFPPVAHPTERFFLFLFFYRHLCLFYVLIGVWGVSGTPWNTGGMRRALSLARTRSSSHNPCLFCNLPALRLVYVCLFLLLWFYWPNMTF